MMAGMVGLKVGTSTYTTSAGSNTLCLAVSEYFNLLDIGHKSPFPLVIGVADVIANFWLLSTYFTMLCHDYHL